MRRETVFRLNVFPLTQVSKRFQLDQEKLYSVITDFLSHRREEILNAQLYKWFSPFDVHIKLEIRPILYQLINELDISDNVGEFYFRNGYFYFKEQHYGPDEF